MLITHRHRIVPVVVTIVAALMASITIARGASAAPSPMTPHTPSSQHVGAVEWTACNVDFFCGRVTVPLDYDRPAGRQISIAVVKLPATDPARRIGSIFVNPGGPGGSGVDFVLDAGPNLFTAEVRARFDIIGFDPRGINRSAPLVCFETQEEADAAYSPFPYPNTDAKKAVWIAEERAVDAACARRGGPILNHMSTADVARDLDRMRQAVGDRMLTYYGISYGSFLGNVYANLFPHRVRAVVIDGVLDPVAWTTGRDGQGRSVPFSTRLRAAAGAQATLNEFFRLCDAQPANCALAPRSGQRYANLYRTLRQDPLPLPLPDGTTLDYDESFLIADTLGVLYSSAVWPEFASALAEIEQAAEPEEVAARLSRVRQASAPPDYINYVEGFPGVACSDSVNPRSYDAWSRAAHVSRVRDGYFGPMWTWISSQCAKWPGRASDRYLGPFTRRTASPVLVVGNLFDPATPYHGAVIANRLLPNSRLLTVRAWGHASLFTSTCADQAIGRYLLTTRPPARGTVCQQDLVPFEQPTAPDARTSARQQAHDRPVRPHW
jgi:pimeloyl-ACP methyl ester carboxylesterase